MVLSQVASLGEMFKIELDELVTRTKLQDIIDDENFIVFQPTVHGIPLRSKNMQPMRFSFYRDNGLFVFDAVMEKSFTKDNLRVCQFKIISDIQKQQRRSSYRLPVVLDAKVNLSQPEVDIPGDPEIYEVQTRDLSDGGMSFTCFEYFPPGTLIDIYLPLNYEARLTLTGKIIRCFLPSEKTVKYNVSVQFINIPSRDQAKISRYIFQTQIKKRNRVK